MKCFYTVEVRDTHTGLLDKVLAKFETLEEAHHERKEREKSYAHQERYKVEVGFTLS